MVYGYAVRIGYQCKTLVDHQDCKLLAIYCTSDLVAQFCRALNNKIINKKLWSFGVPFLSVIDIYVYILRDRWITDYLSCAKALSN